MTTPNQHGGYRAPSQPATSSGPGKLSRRTDGQPLATLPDAAYGEQKTFRNIQKGAPMAESPQTGAPGVSPLDMSRVVPLNAPSQFPGEPVTAGADAGLGPGSAVLGGRVDPSLQNMVDMLPTLEIMASMPSASDSFRNFVRMVRGNS
jgi:hypothetical protein